jgi:hypothetical protein
LTNHLRSSSAALDVRLGRAARDRSGTTDLPSLTAGGEEP